MTFDSIEGTASALSNFTITGGNAYDGGGIYCSSSAPTIKDNIITGNVSDTYGGGISCNYSSPIIMNNTITSNSAIYGGGISFDRYTSSVIKGNNIHGNSAEEGGGIGCFTFSSPTITNNTIVGNSASTNGGGIYCYYVSAPNVTNTIIWDNTASTDPNISVYFSDPYFNYCDVMGSWEGEGNIDADPLFCDAENGDFTVQSDSPVLGAGQDGTDMGAYGVGCEPSSILGCTDHEACNYDETATDDDGSCAYEYDCSGTCGGDLEPDCCGVCGGDNSQCSNCCGMPFPDDCSGVCCSEVCYFDVCGVCDDIPENDCVQDCAGTWGGDAVIDECDVCGGDNTSCQQLGDLNGDGTINVIDIVMAVDLILNDNYDLVGDVNEDGTLDVLDLVILVNWILFP